MKGRDVEAETGSGGGRSG